MLHISVSSVARTRHCGTAANACVVLQNP